MILPTPRAGLRVAALGASLVAGLLSVACVLPPPYRSPENYSVRFSDIERITLVPPLVSVYAMSSGDIEQEVQEWSDAANELAQVAVRDVVAEMGKTYVPFAGERGPRPNFRIGKNDASSRLEEGAGQQSWLLFESAKEAILRHTYDPTQMFPKQMSHFDYTLGPSARDLLAGTQADAFLLMIATDHVPTGERQALIGVGAAAALMTGGYGGPGMTPAELVAALIDAKTGDVLFFNRVSMPLADLRDPASNRALVAGVLAGMGR